MPDSPQAVALAERKRRLLARSESLRQRLAGQVGHLEPALDTVDRVRAGMRWVRRNPGLVVAALLALGVSRPRRAAGWLSRAWLAWQLVPAKDAAALMGRLAGATALARLAGRKLVARLNADGGLARLASGASTALRRLRR